MSPKSRLLAQLQRGDEHYSALIDHHQRTAQNNTAARTAQEPPPPPAPKSRRQAGEKRQREGDVGECVSIFFDGACRGNGTRNARASYGVFHREYDSPFTQFDVIDGKDDTAPVTNNAAEIYACTRAIDSATRIVKQHGPRPITILGDSDVVIRALQTGTATAYGDTSNVFTNAVHWRALAARARDLLRLQSDVKYLWVPRAQNKEADELANAALDNREPNPAVRSVSITTVDINDLDEIVRRLREKRLATLRSIPQSLLQTYKATIQHILRTFQNFNPGALSRIIMCLPHLLSLGRSTIMNNDDHRTVRDHLRHLQNDGYLRHAIIQFRDKLRASEHEPPRPSSEHAQRLATFLKRGLFAKVLQDDDVFPADPADAPRLQQQLSDLFPQGELPEPLQCDHPQPVTVSELLVGIKKLRRGKAPGITGWTKELLSPAVLDMPDDVPHMFADFFSAACNDHLDESVRDLFLQGVLLPLCYKSKASKVRPVIMLDTLTKVSWHVVLSSCPADELNSTSQTTSRSGGCQLAIAAIQSALNEDRIIVSMDAVNAYNTVSRHAAFEFLRRNRDTMKRLFPLVNMFYARASVATWFNGSMPVFSVTITIGSRQGCVSGLHILEWATASVNRRHRQHITQVADDVTIIGDHTRVQDVIRDYATVGQRLDGPKMRILCSEARKAEASTLFPPDKVTTTATRILGGVVTPKGTTDFSTVRREISLKMEKYRKIADLPLNVQQRWLTLLNTTFYPAFYVENGGEIAHDIAGLIDDIAMSTFLKIFDFEGKLSPDELQTLHLQLHTPIEDGGLGLVPFTAVIEHLHRQRADRVAEYVQSFGLTPPPPPTGSKKFQTLTSAWAHYWTERFVPINKHVRPVQAMRSAPLCRYASFLEALPANAYTRFTDDQFIFAVRHRLKLLEPWPLNCNHPDYDDALKKRLRQATCSRREFTDHMQSCTTCTKHLFHRRHEAIIRTVRRVCSFHGYDCRVLSHQQRSLTLPGNSRGGADLLIYHNGTIFALDATVVKETCPSDNARDMLAKAFKTKKKQYEAYAVVTQQVIVPFVMSVYGIVSADTIAALRPIYKTHRTDVPFRTDLLTMPQCVMLKNTAAVHSELRAMVAISGLSTPAECTDTTTPECTHNPHPTPH